MKTLLQRIENDFAYHSPTGGKAAKHQQIRTSCHGLAQELVSIVPEGRELSNALTRLEEVMMHANAGVARNPEKTT